MNALFLTIVGLCAGAVAALQASRRTDRPHWRMVAAGLALTTVVVVVLSLVGPDSQTRRYAAANRRQGYAAGFGLGQYLKQTQPGRRVVVLRCKPDEPRDPETIKGLKAGLSDALTIVGERTLELVTTEFLYRDRAAQFTPALLAELKNTGADIVVSFPGLPTRVGELGRIDGLATLALWRSSEYRALKWVLPRPPQPLPPGGFLEGNVLAVVQDKPQNVPAKGFPAHLEIKGTPAELFKAWFELVTTDDGT